MRISAALRERLAQRVFELHLDKDHRNPLDLARSFQAQAGDIVCLLDIDRGGPDVLGFLDAQRESFADLELSLVVWVTADEHSALINRAPNFYRFRTTVVDFRGPGSSVRMPFQVPILFVSSTVEDLRPYREAARDAAVVADFRLRMQEHFAAAGDRPPLAACLAKVREADLLCVLVAHRYGWVPPDRASGEMKSITWLECEEAVAAGKEVLAFLLDDAVDWPTDKEHREEQAIATAVREGRPDLAALLAEVQAKVEGLKAFKAWLNSRAISVRFTSPEDLRGKIGAALNDWRRRHAEYAVAGAGVSKTADRADPARYLEVLRQRTAYIDIRGLLVGTGKAHRFPIEEIFIPLSTAGVAEEGSKGRRAGLGPEDLGPDGRGRVALQAILRPRCRAVVIGDPGSGKSTFLRRVAHALALTALGEVADAAEGRLGIADGPFPILVRLADLAEHIARTRASRSQGQPPNADSAAWLAHYLAAEAEAESWGLDEAFFRSRLEAGACVLLDGLDEAADWPSRQACSRLIEALARTYSDSRLVVTSRPAAYTGETQLPGFEHAHIEPLEDEAIGVFLGRWCGALYPESADEAERHRAELSAALRSRAEIRYFARNPVMLTALAVVHWNERRIPEQRADLYESILRWLARSREQRSGRPGAERCLALLQALALHMQTHPEGRQVQLPARLAAEAVARELGERAGDGTPPGRHLIERAEHFLDEEELDSGIIVKRGNQVAFWHLTFQEYLAARAIAGRPDPEQAGLLFDPPASFYRPEWREVVLLLAGVLHQQGRPKVDGLIRLALDRLGAKPKLAEQARAAGLLGLVLRDLAPLDYEVADARYPRLLDAVLGVFDAKRSRTIPIETRIEAADALGQSGDPRLEPGHPERYVLIPAESFPMGAQKADPSRPNYDRDASDHEGPVSVVTLDAYRIGCYPVTAGEYLRFLESGGYADPRYWKAGGPGGRQEPYGWEEQLRFPNRPVVGVTWYEAMAYCRWAGGTLPSEAEWERAARGTEGRRYPWGNDPPDPTRCNYGMNIGHPTPVGVYPLGATPEGIHDLAGNVWEWTRSEFCRYPYAASDGRENLERTRNVPRVLRGGAFYNVDRSVRCAFRLRNVPDFHLRYLGVRVVVRPSL
jgi:formylglycine-generating enzyme required for sulfatase activity